MNSENVIIKELKYNDTLKKIVNIVTIIVGIAEIICFFYFLPDAFIELVKKILSAMHLIPNMHIVFLYRFISYHGVYLLLFGNKILFSKYRAYYFWICFILSLCSLYSLAFTALLLIAYILYRKVKNYEESESYEPRDY